MRLPWRRRPPASASSPDRGIVSAADRSQNRVRWFMRFLNGSMLINAVSNSTVPHISLLIGASYGAGHYGMCGRAYDPRFLFAWPSAKSAVMGGAQLAGVLSIVSRAAAEARGQQVDEQADAAMRAAVEGQIEAESVPMVLSGMLYDDGIIDPRDTRTVLGMCLSAIANGPIKGTSNFGVFRM